MNDLVVITGASRGLGETIADKLLKNTHYSIVNLSRSNSNNLLLYKNRYIHIECDLSDTEEIKNIYIQKIKPLGRIVGLVNNSANAYDDLVTNLNYKSLEQMFKINVFSSMMLTKYAIRDMIGNKTRGSIVHISSVSAHTGYKGLAMYASTKGALEAFSKNVAREWGEYGIRSNCVAPGFMETKLSESISEELKKRIYNRTSLKAATDVQSVAETVIFLLSEKANSITGQVLCVDNGTI